MSDSNDPHPPDLAALEAKRIAPEPLAERVVRAYCQMIFVDGVYQLDSGPLQLAEPLGDRQAAADPVRPGQEARRTLASLGDHRPGRQVARADVFRQCESEERLDVFGGRLTGAELEQIQQDLKAREHGPG